MSRCAWALCRLFLCGLLGCCLAAPAVTISAPPEEKAKAGQADQTHEQMMAEWMKYAAPGPNHELMKPLVGSWKTVTKAWMGPGDPQTTEGAAERSLILGGRFLKEEYSGTFMDQPFQGLGLTGYDNIKNEFVGTWTDSMGTGIMTIRGTYNPATKEFTWTGTYPDPATKQDKPVRMVTKIIDGNKHVFQMFENQEGKEVMGMEITYSRK